MCQTLSQGLLKVEFSSLVLGKIAVMMTLLIFPNDERFAIYFDSNFFYFNLFFVATD